MTYRPLYRLSWQKVFLLLLGIAGFWLGPSSDCCSAHPASIVSALAKIRADHTFELRVRFDLLAYALEEQPNRISDAPMNALLDGPTEDLESRLSDAKERFRQNFHVDGGGGEVIDTLTFPTVADVQKGVNKADRLRLPVMGAAVITGHLSPTAKTVTFQFDETLGPVVLTTEIPYQEPFSEPLDAGASSSPIPVPSAASVAKAASALQASAPRPSPSASPSPLSPPTAPATRKVAVAAPKAASSNESVTVSSPTPKPSPSVAVALTSPTPAPTPTPLAAKPSPTPSGIASAKMPNAISTVAAPKKATPALATPAPAAVTTPPAAITPTEAVPTTPWLTRFFRYVKMGYTHILPEGTDHILFVLGLFLLSTKIKPLIKQVTAFTIAHSLTLALSLYGVIHLPATVVEPVIAASIAFVAIENLCTTEMKNWRLAIVFGFGLIHGLGFAEALRDLGLRHNDLLTALVGFNGGVELGQLSVVALAFLLVGRLRNRPYYRKFVVVPGSLAIAVIAIFWMFQRLLPAS